MCLEKSYIHKKLNKPFIAKNNIIVYKALDAKKYDGTKCTCIKCTCTPYMYLSIVFFEGKCILKEPNMEINGEYIYKGLHSYTTEERCKKTCDEFHDETGTRKFWAVIPKGSKYFIGKDKDIVSDNLIIFKNREEFRKYKKENKCVKLNLELSKELLIFV